MNKNIIARAHLVKQIVDQNYEAGRQDRCKLWIYRHIVVKTYPMSAATFFRYLRIAGSHPKPQQPVDPRQQNSFNLLIRNL